MKFSKYNHLFQLDGTSYIYNILTTSIAQLDKQTENAINENNFSALTNDTIDGLRAEGFIVSQDLDESLEYQYFCNTIKYGISARTLSVTLLPTYNCNLACPYCIQGSIKRINKMSKKEVEACLKFIRNKIEEGKRTIPVQRLSIFLFGGEPTLCKKELSYFCQECERIAEEEGIEIGFDMTTNMTLLDQNLLDMIKKYQIAFQVSIDGTKEQHDKRRIRKDGSGTYDLILENLQRLVDYGLKHLITIRINIDNENLDSAEEILKSVKDYSNDIYFGFLTSLSGVNDNYTDKCVNSDCFSNVISTKLNNITEKYGFVVPQSFGKKGPCSIACQNKFFIDYNLDVFKCEMLLNRTDSKIGSIDYEGNFTPSNGFYKMMAFSPFNFKECVECKYLPVCGGGCPAQVYANSGKKDGDISEKNCCFNEALLNDYLKEYVSRLLK